MKLNGKSKAQILGLLFPGLFIFGMFTVYPIVRLFWMSFFKWDFGSFLDQEFIGFRNYADVLSDENFRIAFTNTIVYTLVTVPAQMFLGLMVALLMPAVSPGISSSRSVSSRITSRLATATT